MTATDKKSLRPMLAATATAGSLKDLPWPLLGQKKIDGVRCILRDGVAWSRSGKPIANKFVQKWAAENRRAAVLDGELVIGNPTDPDVFHRTSGALRRADGEPDFTYYVFDCLEPTMTDMNRQIDCQQHAGFLPRAETVQVVYLHTPEDALLTYEANLLEGYEGLMLRDPKGQYKHGRSTEAAGPLWKLKPRDRAEARIEAVEALMTNLNDVKEDELGHMVRSSRREGKKARDMAGVLICTGINGPFEGKEIRVGSGFTEALRKDIWENFDRNYEGAILTYEYAVTGCVDKPRHPVFIGIRDESDMDA